MNYHIVNETLASILNNKIDIDVNLLHKAQTIELKLKEELEIKEMIKNLQFVENYKTIKKSVTLLNEKVKSA